MSIAVFFNSHFITRVGCGRTGGSVPGDTSDVPVSMASEFHNGIDGLFNDGIICGGQHSVKRHMSRVFGLITHKVGKH